MLNFTCEEERFLLWTSWDPKTSTLHQAGPPSRQRVLQPTLVCTAVLPEHTRVYDILNPIVPNPGGRNSIGERERSSYRNVTSIWIPNTQHLKHLSDCENTFLVRQKSYRWFPHINTEEESPNKGRLDKANGKAVSHWVRSWRLNTKWGENSTATRNAEKWRILRFYPCSASI